MYSQPAEGVWFQSRAKTILAATIMCPTVSHPRRARSRGHGTCFPRHSGFLSSEFLAAPNVQARIQTSLFAGLLVPISSAVYAVSNWMPVFFVKLRNSCCLHLTERPIISLEFLCAVKRRFHLADATSAREPVLQSAAIGELCAVSFVVSDGHVIIRFCIRCPSGGGGSV